jgi:hypothetical protein
VQRLVQTALVPDEDKKVRKDLNWLLDKHPVIYGTFFALGLCLIVFIRLR